MRPASTGRHTEKKMGPTHFTQQEANDLVPWLEETFRSIAPLHQRARRLREEVAAVEHRIRGNGGSEAGGDLEQHRRHLAQTIELIENRIDEVQRKGIIVRNVETGLVDFPTLEKGREIYLCWQRGEPEVAYWHEADSGFAGRQPI